VLPLKPAAWALGWLILLISGYYGCQLAPLPFVSAVTRQRLKRYALFILLAITLVSRLVPAIILPVGASYDIDSFRLVAEAFLRGEAIYSSATAVGRHPYLPFQLYLIAGSLWLAQTLLLPFVLMIKMPAILADVAITAVIYHAVRRSGQPVGRAALVAVIFALNPISIIVTAYHGQFDAIPVLLLLISWYFWRFGRRAHYSALALGFAILSKTWPIIFLPVVLSRMRGMRAWLVYGAIALIIPALFTAFYLLVFPEDARALLGRSLTHTGVSGYWGISGILNLMRQKVDEVGVLYSYFVDWRRILLLIGLAFAFWRTRSGSSLDALTTILLTLLAITSGMGLQWLLWVVPFALLAGDIRGLNWYTMGGAIYLTLQLYGYHFGPWVFEVFDPVTARNLIILSSYPAWIVVIIWAGQRLFGGRPVGSPEAIAVHS
jgi:Gpi18-like mannosyltransferase